MLMKVERFSIGAERSLGESIQPLLIYIVLQTDMAFEEEGDGNQQLY